MSWTYDDTELPSSDTSGLSSATDEQKKNFIRLIAGDTNTDIQLTSDEAIYAFLNTEPNVYYAAARTALAIVQDVLAGGMEDQKVGETRIRMKRAQELTALANDMRQRGATHMLPAAGGIFESDRTAEAEDTDKLQPAIIRGVHDITGNQRGGRTDTGDTGDGYY